MASASDADFIAIVPSLVNRYVRFPCPPTFLAVSVVLLVWQLRNSSAVHRRADSERSSARGIASKGLEGLLLGTCFTLGQHDTLTEGSDQAWVRAAFWSYLVVLFLLRNMPPPGFEYTRNAVWQHSLFFYILSWFVAMATLQAGATATVVLSCLLVTILVSPRPLPEYNERSLDPTGESRASVFGLLSFAWLDGMLLKAWRSGTLKAEDVPILSAADAAAPNAVRYKQTGSSLLLNLLRHYRFDLLTQALLASFLGVLNFVPTLLLGSILQHVEGTKATSTKQVQYHAVLLFLTSILASVAESQALWIGQKIGLRMKSILINQVYEKALRRPIASRTSDSRSTGQRENQPASRASTGTIMNLFTTDISMIADSGANMHQVWASVPVQILLAITLLYFTLGYSAFVGVALMAAMVPVNSRISQRFGAIQMQVMAASDARIQTTTEMIHNIRAIKLIAWGPLFRQQINDKRAAELRILRSRYILWSTAATIWYGMPLLITFSSFLVYALILENPLTPSLAFTSLSLFNLLKMPLDDFVGMLSRVQACLVSIRRVEDFLAEDETKKHKVVRDTTTLDEIGFEDATFDWSGGRESEASNEKGPDGFTLQNLSLKFKAGKLTIVFGPTGCGKSSLLLALLGEMPLVKGTVRMPAAASRETLSADANAGLINSVAFCAQEAWLTNDTVRNNILFGRHLDEERYKAVLDACALMPDLKILSQGDLTPVGDGGVSLSGGQKQRVALARAVYSPARHLLLDDSLSAVDNHTASWIFQRCIAGSLMKGRTCVLVTHNVTLVASDADYIVKMEHGTVIAAGTAQDLAATGHLPKLVKNMTSSGITESANHTEKAATDGSPSRDAIQECQKREPSQGAGSAESLDTSLEPKADGTIPKRTALKYLSAMGGWRFWILLVFFFTAQQVGSIMTNWWVRELSNATVQAGMKSTNMSDGLSHQSAPSVSYYFGVYAFLLLVYLIVGFLRLFTLSLGSLTASGRIHNNILQSVMGATLAFFNDKSFGQLVNLFSGDIRTVDQDLAVLAIATLHFAGALAGITTLIIIVTPTFLLPGTLISVVYYLIAVVYITASRDLQKMESSRRTPLSQHLGETLSGVVTIRAYGVEEEYSTTALALLDKCNQPSFFLASTERWLVFRLSLTGAFVSLFAGIFAITSAGRLSAGTIGLSMSYAISFSEHVLWLIRYYMANSHNMAALERIQNCFDLTQEAREATGGTKPLQDWPASGVVQYDSVSARYAPHLERVLRDVSFTIASREKVGVVGRTGAGKSSLALTLLRGLEIETGQIMIDGLNTREGDLHELRRRLAYVPQDPILFAGTLRFNLDPFGGHTDEEMLNAIGRVGLLDSWNEAEADPSATTSGVSLGKFGDLSLAILDAGSNISQGQRQLVCIARAILKGSSIVILDEATASIDHESDLRIQACVRKMQATVITIAHRLRTVIDYDRIIGLDAGQVKECNHAWQLLQRQDGIFKDMCESAVDRDELVALAKAAWYARSNVA